MLKNMHTKLQRLFKCMFRTMPLLSFQPLSILKLSLLHPNLVTQRISKSDLVNSREWFGGYRPQINSIYRRLENLIKSKSTKFILIHRNGVYDLLKKENESESLICRLNLRTVNFTDSYCHFTVWCGIAVFILIRICRPKPLFFLCMKRGNDCYYGSKSRTVDH